MPFPINVKLDGLKEAVARLSSLKTGARNKILRPAVSDGLKPVHQAVKQRVPKASGLLRRSVARKVAGSRKSGAVTGLVGPRTGMKQAVTRPDGSTVESDPAKYAHLAEFGRQAVVVKTRRVLSNGRVVFGKTVRAARARPFLRPAWAASKAAAEQAVAARVAAEIQKLAARGK